MTHPLPSRFGNASAAARLISSGNSTQHGQCLAEQLARFSAVAARQAHAGQLGARDREVHG